MVSGHGSLNQYLMPDEDSEIALAGSSKSATMRSFESTAGIVGPKCVYQYPGPRQHPDYFRLARTGLPRAKDA